MATEPAGAVTGAERKCPTQKVGKTPDVPKVTAEAVQSSRN